MTPLVKIWNCEPYPVCLNANERAILPCDWTRVPVEVAVELCAGPSFSYDNPRPRPRKFTNAREGAKGPEALASPIEEEDLL